MWKLVIHYADRMELVDPTPEQLHTMFRDQRYIVDNSIGRIVTYRGDPPQYIPAPAARACAYCGTRAGAGVRCDSCGAPYCDVQC